MHGIGEMAERLSEREKTEEEKGQRRGGRLQGPHHSTGVRDGQDQDGLRRGRRHAPCGHQAVGSSVPIAGSDTGLIVP